MQMRLLLASIMLLALLCGCATTTPLPPPSAVKAPQPIMDNTGVYMCPYTSDDTVAEWIDRAMSARFGRGLGAVAGALAGQQIAKDKSGILGALGGYQLGSRAGRTLAIQAAGGWAYIRKTSDLSFERIDDLAVYIYSKYTDRPDYDKVVDLTIEIYPELKKRYRPAITGAGH